MTTAQDDTSAVKSPTFGKDGSFHVDEAVGSASISPSGRDVVLASRQGLHIIDLDNPYSPPRHFTHRTPWEVADVQWSPFASRDFWVVSTSNQKALVWNLEMKTNQAPIQHILHAHSRAITDINFSAHDPVKLATCAVDSFVHCWDLRQPSKPAISFADWYAGATQVKWNRQDPHIIASSHDRYLHIWDDRKGARPLRTVDAHATKIYGIDWNRTTKTNILTCSLDKTIKFWDYEHECEADENTPTRIIRTSYPVWRARHTPFGSGVLAMPQRWNHDLHLYDGRLKNEAERDAYIDPVRAFTGHRDQVKEFLWRYQGSIDEGIDNRSFQLVSWSLDKNLLLHRVDDETLAGVGYRKGEPAPDNLFLSRKGAVYRTFHDRFQTEAAQMGASALPSTGPPSHGLSTLFRVDGQSSMRKAPIPLVGWVHQASESYPRGMRVRSGTRKDANPINWMKGVKIGAGRNETLEAPPWDTQSLGDEIAHAGDKYKKVAFELVDVSDRTATFSLTGPWGVGGSFVHVKTAAYFPQDYPRTRPPQLAVERTSSISDASFTRLRLELNVICETYAKFGRGSLEAVICYLLGDSDLERSIAWAAHDGIPPARSHVDESSSDEEDDGLGNFRVMPSHDLEGSSLDIRNANVPLPKACGALWADDGRLICFFPPKNENSLILGGGRKPRPSSVLESGADPTKRSNPAFDSEDDSSEFSDSSSTSSASSDATGPLNATWGGRMKSSGSVVRSTGLQTSEHTLTFGKQRDRSGADRQLVVLHSFEDLQPCKKPLAEEYKIFGQGPDVCAHNALVASKHGYSDLVDAWSLCGLTLRNDVPLELTALPESGMANVLVLARRMLVHIKKRDSGLDLAFDEPEAVVNPITSGRVKWGQHPLAGSWLIKLVFEYFERIADVQMLAMLSCVLSEPLGSLSGHVQHVDSRRMALPAFSPEYFQSSVAAASLSSQGHSQGNPLRARDGREAKHSYGTSVNFGSSYTSSNGAWSSESTEMERQPSHSSNPSPPAISRQNSRSFSSSPEQTMRRSSSTVSNAFAASISRPFAFMASASSSPPAQQSRTPELSTSAPTHGHFPSSSVTWGRNTVYDDSPSFTAKVDSQLNVSHNLDTLSDSDEEEIEAEDVVISFKNQNLFDDEACLSLPLLDWDVTERYRAYRNAYAHILDVWGFHIAQSEISTFDGVNASSPGTTRSSDESVFTLSKKTSIPGKEGPLGVATECEACVDGVKHRSARHTCHKFSTASLCCICSGAVSGLYEFCSMCGHVTHPDCLELWYGEQGYRGMGCEAGCGCMPGAADGREGLINGDFLQERVRQELKSRDSLKRSKWAHSSASATVRKFE